MTLDRRRFLVAAAAGLAAAGCSTVARESTPRWRLLGAVLTLVMMTSCSGNAESTPAPGLPGEQMVFMVMSSGGMAPAVYQALSSPSLAIYGDGRVLTALETPVLQLLPARYEVARIDPAAVASFVADVEAGGLITNGTDFGTPRVTDLPSTSVLMHGSTGQQQVSVYAFDERFDARLTADQRSARVALRAAIEKASALAAGAARVPYSPDRVVVYEVEPGSNSEPATAGWPGPPTSTFLAPSTGRRSIACGELNADPAGVAYRAALTNPGARWLVDNTTRILAVNPLPLPDACG